MGIDWETGYSSNVEGFLQVGDLRMRLAKTNGTDFVLTEPSGADIPAGTDALLVIIIDGDKDAKSITLSVGVTAGQRTVPYENAVPF